MCLSRRAEWEPASSAPNTPPHPTYRTRCILCMQDADPFPFLLPDTHLCRYVAHAVSAAICFQAMLVFNFFARGERLFD